MKSWLGFIVVCFLLLPLQTLGQNGVATLMVLVDLSSSMNAHREKLTKLAPIVEAAMKKTQCEFRVAVGNIQYKSNRYNSRYYLKPWGKPAYVTQDTPDGAKKIHDRISNPNDVDFPGIDEDQQKGHPANSDERTYSSIVASIEINLNEINDSHVVGTILLTDAAPAFETYGPKEAADKIQQLLGSHRPYLSAIIGANLNQTMMVENPKYFCTPDFPGTQAEGSKVNTSSWDTQNIEAINQFSQSVGGWQWDICQPEYDKKLKDFIDRVLAMGGCLPLS